MRSEHRDTQREITDGMRRDSHSESNADYGTICIQWGMTRIAGVICESGKSWKEHRLSSVFVALCLMVSVCPRAYAGLNGGPEYDALQALYAATSGSTWADNAGWNTGDACAWHGITCDQNNTPGDNTSHVTVLNLHSNGLAGSLAALPALTVFPSLTFFDVGQNQLTGAIPALNGLSGLTYFSVYSNKLTGSIPSELAGLVNLQYVFVHSNRLTGSIPTLAGLANLQVFYAYENQLTGSIPSLMGLSNLNDFEVFSNQLTGPLPLLAGLNSLQYFWVYTNNLTGPIPQLSGLVALLDFQVGNNNLTGSIPALTGLVNLNYFDVRRNQLTGSIPDLTGLTGLQYFLVGENRLTGAVPAAPVALNGFKRATLCPNPLDTTPNLLNDGAWNTATGFTPWWADPYPNNNCDDTFTSTFEP